MLIELALRGRLQLEACGMRRKGLLTRKVGRVPLLTALTNVWWGTKSYVAKYTMPVSSLNV